MSVPWVQGFGEAIYSGFGMKADEYREMQAANLQGTKATMVNLNGALRGPAYTAAQGSDEVIGQVTMRNIQHAQEQSETGMSVGNHFGATLADVSTTLTIGDGATA